MKQVKHMAMMLMMGVMIIFGSHALALSQQDPININQADVKTLQLIKGIGAKRAQAIVAYRKANGPFENFKQLTQIKGIGAKRLEKIRSYLTLGK